MGSNVVAMASRRSRIEQTVVRHTMWPALCLLLPLALDPRVMGPGEGPHSPRTWKCPLCGDVLANLPGEAPVCDECEVTMIEKR